jgi:hypothetical protein
LKREEDCGKKREIWNILSTDPYKTETPELEDKKEADKEEKEQEEF